DTPELLLDEATSAADPATERGIQRALRRLAADRTVIAVSHRLAQAPAADRIIVLDAGRIQGIGTHAELLADCAVYR
ncbi:multidrug ABC transporter ATP-binding protein, partial [Salmonella enterica]|nr:multidrug ABC transporter ATP-binding protein [Salmonella enterica]